MDSDNGNGKIKQEEVKNEPKVIITIKLFPDGHTELESGLSPPMVVWTMEQLKMALLQPKAKAEEKIIHQGGIMRFARGGFRK